VIADYKSSEIDSFQELAQLGEWLVQKEERAKQ
jgi:hypothetical protein